MPKINVEFDDKTVTPNQAFDLSEAIQRIVSEATKIKDVFVYTNSAQIKVKVAPVEIFIEMSAHKINNEDKLMQEIKSKLSRWKKENKFNHPINLTLIPMNWKLELGI